jgi:hypothetical protein
MVIRLVSLQVPRFWDIIKYSLQQTERIGIDDSQKKFNNIFAALLSDKAQCFIKHKEGEIKAVMITELAENRIEGSKSLYIRSLYAFSPFELLEWQEYFPLIKDLAKSFDCQSISFNSNHHKLHKVAMDIGFKQAYINMAYSIGD